MIKNQTGLIAKIRDPPRIRARGGTERGLREDEKEMLGVK